MKFATIATIVTATAGFAAAQPHKQHAHHHARRGGNIVTVYELNGKIISAQEVQEGIENGTLVIDGPTGQLAHAAAAPAAAPAKPAAKPLPKLTVNVEDTPSAKAVPASAPAAKPAKPAAPAVIPGGASHSASLELNTASSSSIPASSGSDSFSMTASGVGSSFPDGQLSCSTFPSQYGALAVPWMNIGGWSGIQSPGSSAGGFSNIATKIAGDSCSEGDYCSYACPPGYEKTQWPSTQGSTGQSVGGLLCQGGKLHLTNPSLSKSLCAKGSEVVNVQVKNTMNQVAAVCRTEYPGTESMVIPLSAAPGSTNPLTCPNQDTYYHWGGKTTSAQYYVNPAGVSVSDACIWGDASKPVGNFAPLNLGISYTPKDGMTWIGIFQNAPTTTQKLDFTVEVVGDNGTFDNILGKCRYKNGQYCGGANYETCNTQGCTASVKSGTATIQFSS